MADRSYEKKKHKIKQAMNIGRLRDYNLEVEQLPNQLRHREFDVILVNNQLGQKTKLAIK
jgi:hypothetical protein